MAVPRSATFFVDGDKQRGILQDFKREKQQLSETYDKNKPLCFSAGTFQRTHPGKAKPGHRDADVTLGTDMVLGVADGVSQIEDYGIDASLLPKELMQAVEELAAEQLTRSAMPEVLHPRHRQDAEYRGPIPLLREAFEQTSSLGSTTVVLAMLDNSTKIHGKLHPMVAVITVGDCELMLMRRSADHSGRFVPSFYTEMQRIDGHAQTPLQLARVDDRIDPDFHEDLTIEVIERGSAVHCVSAYEGDILVMGSDGVFDNLFLDEIVDLCNVYLPPQTGPYRPIPPATLNKVSKALIDASHAKTEPDKSGVLCEAPIGKGGKMDDTSVVVAEVIAWSNEHTEAWLTKRGSWMPQPFGVCRCGSQDSESVYSSEDDVGRES